MQNSVLVDKVLHKVFASNLFNQFLKIKFLKVWFFLFAL